MTFSLVTGASGLIGRFLLESLEADSMPAVATALVATPGETSAVWAACDIRASVAVRALIQTHRPDVIYHLAAQSLPGLGLSDPWSTFDININGTLNVFEAVKAVRAEAPEYDPVIVVASSAMVYGASLVAGQPPVTEDAPLRPLHPYGISKATQDFLAHQYFLNDGIRAIRARIFNCAGPRKRGDVVSDFARAVAQSMGTGAPVRVGNLQSRRAIMDVRDMVAALRALAAKGQAGEAYNICTDQVVTIGALLDMVFEVAGRRFAHVVDPALLRSADEAVIVGNTSKLRRDTGWAPVIPLRQTVQDVYAFESAQLAKAA